MRLRHRVQVVQKHTEIPVCCPMSRGACGEALRAVGPLVELARTRNGSLTRPTDPQSVVLKADPLIMSEIPNPGERLSGEFLTQ